MQLVAPDDRSHFRVDIDSEGYVTVVAVYGEVDLAVERELVSALRLAVGSSDAVVVDLCACTFMDSRGLVAVLNGWRTAQRRGSAMTVACTPDEACDRLFTLALGGVLDVHASRASAVGAVLAS